VGAALRLPDGKFIVAVARQKYVFRTDELLRIHPDGSIDSSFPPVLVSSGIGTGSPGNARGLVLQPDGRLLVTGTFTQFGTHGRPGVVRLLPDGSLDTSFAPVPLLRNTTGTTPGFLALDDPLLQPDGKIVIYGDFRRIGSASYATGVARLHPDGTVDTTFQPAGFTRSNAIRTAVLQAGREDRDRWEVLGRSELCRQSDGSDV
jgi:uncharacterized delta-60 repeat protein